MQLAATRRTTTVLLLALLALLAGCATGPKEPAELTDAAAGDGRVVEGTANPLAFRPEAPTGEFDLKVYFEGLGPDAIEWYQHVQTLANPYFEGRVNGSAGSQRARDYIEWNFKRLGLQPAFPGGVEAYGGAVEAALVSYRQPFEFEVRGERQINVENASLAIDGVALAVDEDFVVLGNSGNGAVSGPVSFVGYGIADGPDGYTSFDEDTDLTGRVAVLLRYEPLDANGVSRWARGEQNFSSESGLARKLRQVARRNAAGILLVNPPGARDARVGLEPLSRSGRFGRAFNVPVAQVSTETASRLLAQAGDGSDLMAWRVRADEGRVRTVDLGESTIVSLGVEIDRKSTRNTLSAENVGAILPGRGALAGEYVVIGGHYDHNGYGWFGTSPADGPLFPGADDNASGTAGMLVLARKLAERYAGAAPGTSMRSILFIAFDAEERGLHGSRRYREAPSVPPERTAMLLNMDMIGRMRGDQLSVMGTATGEGLQEIVNQHFASSGLTVTASPGGSGRSDDANFHRMGVPAMHFFTGMHDEYTSPADQAYTVNPDGAAKVVDLIDRIAYDLATRPQAVAFAGEGGGDGPRRPTADRGYGPVRLGIRPAMGDDVETGVGIASVSPGASAEVAGIRAGDVLLAWNGTDLESVRSLMEMLQEHEPGDVVTIAVLRDGQVIDVPVTLQESSGGR